MEIIYKFFKFFKVKSISAIILFLVFATSYGQLNGTYTIGGSSADYITISEAVGDLQVKGVSGPIIFKLESGIYNEQLVIEQFPGNSCENKVMFESASGNQDVQVQYTLTNSDDSVIKIDGADGITFKNMIFTRSQGSLSQSKIFYLLGGTDCFQLENNLIIGGDSNDILVESVANSLEISNNDHSYINNIFRNGMYGINSTGADSNFRDNRILISGNTFEALEEGIWISNRDNIEIISNSFSVENKGIAISQFFGQTKIVQNSINTLFGQGIRLYNGGGYQEIMANKVKVEYFRLAGIEISQSNVFEKPSIVANNFVTVTGTLNNPEGYGLNISASNYLVYYNNILALGSRLSASYFSGSNLDVRNNIFENSGGYYAIYVESYDLNLFDYNAYFSNGIYFAKFSSTNINSIIQLQQETGQDENSLVVDPLFDSETELRPNAMELDGAGDPVSVNEDINGNLRDINSPDIGAIEFGIDSDGDEIPDNIDNCVSVANFDQLDTDGDGEGDACDLDDDNDGIADSEDCAPLDPTIGAATIWYADTDADGYGDPNVTDTSCTQPEGFVADNTDCNDWDLLVNPNTAWYPDIDDDGFGDKEANAVIQCTSPSSIITFSYATNNLDCNDNDRSINPNATEIANDGIDQDCDGEDLIILGDDGCSANFWKTRITWCINYNQQDDFYETFGITDDKGLGANLTLLSSLDGKKGEWGKLAQQATAAILNFCDINVLYSISGSDVISSVQTVFNNPNSGRNEAKLLREQLEMANNSVCPLNDVVVDREGCSVEYWVLPNTVWCSSYSQGVLFHDTFGISNFSRIGNASLTLLEALNLKGGGFNKLAKEATAALLNACSGGVDFPLSVDQIITGTSKLFNDPAYGNKDANNLSSLYADANNSVCPYLVSVQSTTLNSSDSSMLLEVYPNPLESEGIWLQFSERSVDEVFDATIFDLYGRPLTSTKLSVSASGGEYFWQVDHNGWAQGVYLLLVRNGNQEFRIKLIK